MTRLSCSPNSCTLSLPNSLLAAIRFSPLFISAPSLGLSFCLLATPPARLASRLALFELSFSCAPSRNGQRKLVSQQLEDTLAAILSAWLRVINARLLVLKLDEATYWAHGVHSSC
jgi:hypothetical protein